MAPLFYYRSLPWSPPDPATIDALLLTSAAAVRLGGDGLTQYRTLPVQAVGTATAEAARLAGFANLATGKKDGNAAAVMLAASGQQKILHLCGQDHVAVGHPLLTIRHIAVYVADAVEHLPTAAALALNDHAVALLHSPRAARVFGTLLDHAKRSRATVRLACFSQNVADAAGVGWAGVEIANVPTDDALFAAARMLCDQDPNGTLER
ncbi:uroporphyrinogen-III synthase [Sphingomonas prati]|uniref:Uroporphyrinogen-III synthase n=1 Tax=Sphingomonas prati TaxID=1843237 RepID=A0A7W9BRL7_9SPHN|nr:uroporphyrinogen-III synthase [Sphingomonas prati]